MNVFQNIEFEHPWVLAMILLLPLLYWWVYIKRRNFIALLPLPVHFPADQTLKISIYRFLPSLKITALGFLILALSGPKLLLREETVNAEGIDIIIAMDVSLSMLALDFKPDRLEAGKKLAKEFIGKRKYDRIGLVIFSGESFTISPVTTDLELLKTYVDQVRAGVLKDGTAIGNGLASAINRLKDSKSESKVIILLTDGVNNTGYIDPVLTIDMAKEYKIKIYTIGIGTNAYAESPVATDIFGKLVFEMVRVELDEELLKNIAESTNGRYYRATDNKKLEEIYNEIDKLEKTKIEVNVFKRHAEEFRLFTIIAMFLLVSVFILENTILRTIP